MADVLDYASQQGDDIGIYIAFILAFLIYLIPVGFVGYWAIKFVGYMIKSYKQKLYQKVNYKTIFMFQK